MSRSPSPRQAASRRLADLITAGKYRRQIGGVLDPGQWLFYFANCLGHAPASTAPMRTGAIWRGLDILELRRVVEMIDLGEFTDDDLGEQIARINPGSPLISAQKLGEQIGLTVEERDNLDIRSIDAAGQSKADRDSAKQARALMADRVRKAASRARDRALGKVRSREDYLSSSTEARKPWLQEGCSRRTWYGRQKAPRIISAQVASGSLGTPAAQVQSGHLIYNRVGRPDLCNVDVAASEARLQRSEPSSGPGLGAGFAVADRNSTIALSGAGSRGSKTGLGDESQPKSEASKKETARPGRTIHAEDPREVVVELFPDPLDRGWLVETLGHDCDPSTTVAESGWRRVALLGLSNLQRLSREATARGGLINADDALDRARALAIRLENLQAVRRAAP